MLVYINDKCVLGCTHQDVVGIFQTIPIGGKVALKVCRGYPLPFDPDDPNTEIVTTVAVTLPQKLATMSNTLSYSRPAPALPPRTPIEGLQPSQRNIKSMPDLSQPGNPSDVMAGSGFAQKNRSVEELPSSGSPMRNLRPELFTIHIVKGAMGFGFTIADSVYGQRVKQIVDRARCKTLQEGDILLEINRIRVKDMPHSDVVGVLKDCAKFEEAAIVIQRGGKADRTEKGQTNNLS